MNNSDFYTKDDRKYVRVTHVQNLLSKPALIQWAVNCGLDYVWQDSESPLTDITKSLSTILHVAKSEWRRESKRAMEIGSLVHHRISGYELKVDATEIDSSLAEPVEFGYNSFLKWQKEFHAVPKQQEIVVYSERYGYAGTLDWIGSILEPRASKTKLYMVDFKVSGYLYPEQHVMQLAAYEQAYFETYGKHIKNLANVRLSKDKIGYEWREYTKEERGLGWDGFLALLNLWEMLEKFKKIKRRNNGH